MGAQQEPDCADGQEEKIEKLRCSFKKLHGFFRSIFLIRENNNK